MTNQATPNAETDAGVATEGQRITTRYFGGYESVKVIQVHPTYYIVSRFSGQATDILPKAQVEKIFDADNNEIFSAVDKQKIHPALQTYAANRSDAGKS